MNQGDVFNPKKGNKEQAAYYAMLPLAATEHHEGSYSPLGEPDLRDLPSFAYQISQGMVYKSAAIINGANIFTFS